MLVKEEEELSRRFARYTDEELDRLLTAGSGRHSWDELTMAAWELSRRRGPAPAAAATPTPPAGTHGPAQPRSPYLFIDLLFDALLCGSAVWAIEKLTSWTATAGPWGPVICYPLVFAFGLSALSLRRRWRAREWRD